MKTCKKVYICDTTMKNTWLKQITDQILNFIKTRKEEIQDMTSVIDISGFEWVRSSFAKKKIDFDEKEIQFR